MQLHNNKRHTWKRRLLLVAALLLVGLVAMNSPATPTGASTTNIIVMIGDGMGFEEVEAARYYSGAPLSFEGLPYQAEMTTYSADSSVTDSAASGTAMATGHKVDNGVISVAIPGDRSDLETVLEEYKALGKMTGLVTTAYVSHATPASWGAHESSRNNYSQIAADMLNDSKPNILMGGASAVNPSSAGAAGYTVVTDRDTMEAVDTDNTSMLSGQFGSGYMPYEYAGGYTGPGSLPHLSEMTVTALDVLDNDPDGFFLMVEGARIDHAGHSNLIYENIYETIEFGNAVQEVITWVDNSPTLNWNNTLLIVTADHETGGLNVTGDNGAGNLPDYTWSTGSHSGVNVPVYARGLDAEQVTGVIDNTDIYHITTAAEEPSTTATPTVMVPPTETPVLPPTGSIDVRISSGSDDVEEHLSTGEMYASSSDLELGDDDLYFGPQSLGLRFNNLAIPQGVTIVDAYIEFVADETDTESTSVTFRAQAADNAPAFGSYAYDLTSRPMTAASVDWNYISSWNTIGQTHQSPDLSAVVQEVVGRSGWNQNNSMVFEISGTGRRVADSYEGGSTVAALLHVEYEDESQPTATPPPPTDTPVPPTATPVPPTNTPDPSIVLSFQYGVYPDADYEGTEDTTLYEDTPDVNYGGDVVILIDGDDPPGTDHDLSTLLRWDTDVIPPGSIVQEASITLNVFNVSPNTYQFYELLSSWEETEATWQQAANGVPWQAEDRGNEVATITANSTGAHVIPLNSTGLAMVQSWINSPGSNYGVLIANSEETDGLDIHSREAATPANRPMLNIRYLPGPTLTPSPTATNTPVPPTATNTPVPTATNTPVPPTATNTPVPTATNTPVPPTATNTPVPTATNTPVPPTATNTPVPTATNTPVPPTATNMPLPTATNTPVPPTATNTPLPTATNTPVPPTATNTPPPTATNTAVPPTATNTPLPTATNTAVPPTATNTPPPTATNTAVPPTATNTPPPPTATPPPPTATPPPPTATPPPSSGPKLVHGTVNNVGSSGWKVVSLPSSYNSMVVVASANYGSGDAPGVVRIQNTSGNQFDVRVDAANGTDAISGVTVHYSVIEEGVYTEAEHGLKAEAVRYQSTVTDRKSNWVGESRSYANQYQSPVVVGQVMSYSDPDWSVFWSRGSSSSAPPSSSTLYTGKHVGEDSNTTRSSETIGYMVFESGSGNVNGVDFVAAVGSDSIAGFDDSPPYTYGFGTLQSADSAIVSQVAMDGGNGGWPILYGPNPLTSNSVDLAVDEDQFADSERVHTNEQASYIIFGEALAVGEGPHVATGVVTGVSTSGWTNVSLDRSYDSMVVVASVNYDESQTPIVARVRTTSNDSFDVRIDRADTSIAPISGITVHYVVVEEGLYTLANHGVKMEAVRYSSTLTDENSSWSGEARSYSNSYTNPVVLGQVMSDNDPAWSVFWARGSSVTNPPNGSLYVGKHVGEDSDTTRGDEVVGYIVIESGSGTIDGQAYYAGLGSDIVKGVLNAPPYTYALSGLSSASVAVVSVAGMDGNNGGWPLLYGSAPLSATALQLAFDEDIIKDTERSHTSEQVAFIVFE